MPGLSNPLLIASTAASALSLGGKAKPFLQKNWKTIAVVGSVGVSGYLLYRHFAGNKPAPLKSNNNYAPSTLTDFEVQQAVQQLRLAVEEPGTKEQAILNVLNGKDYNDFVKISNAFGTPKYFPLTGKILSDWSPFGEYMSLYQILTYELGEEELKQLNQVMPNVLVNQTGIATGLTVAPKEQGTNVFEAEKIDGVWHKQELHKVYAKGEKIGKVIEVIQDPWETNKKYAIIDGSWSLSNIFGTKNLFVETSKLMVV